MAQKILLPLLSLAIAPDENACVPFYTNHGVLHTHSHNQKKKRLGTTECLRQLSHGTVGEMLCSWRRVIENWLEGGWCLAKTGGLVKKTRSATAEKRYAGYGAKDTDYTSQESTEGIAFRGKIAFPLIQERI